MASNRFGFQSYVVCLYNDSEGIRGSEKLKKALSRFAMVRSLDVTEGKDVNDLTNDEFAKLYNNRE